MSDIRQLGTRIKPKGGTKRRVIFLAGGSVGLVLIWYVVERRNASQATTDTTATDTNVTDSGIDPTTGAPYTSDYSTPDLSSYNDPSTGAVITGSGAPTVVTRPSTNAQWVQQAIAYLVQSGFDPVTVSVALGKYISNRNLTDGELSVVQAALAAEGNPPNPPPPPHVAPPAGQPTGVTSGTTKPKTPTGLRVVSKTKTNAVIGWNAATGATGYRLKHNGIVARTSKYTSIEIALPGKWSVASVRGTYTSAYSAPIDVKGI